MSGGAAAVLAVDGGNSKTHVALLAADGTVLAAVRGSGSNHQNSSYDGAMAVLTELVGKAAARAGLDGPPPYAEQAVFHLAGADLADEIGELRARLLATGWAGRLEVDNDTFALLRAGASGPDAVAVTCGGGINCVGATADGRTLRFPSLGVETGDWGGGGALGMAALWHGVRAEDGRGDPTTLAARVAAHFGRATALEVGEAVFREVIDPQRLRELAPAVYEECLAGDRTAGKIVLRLGREVAVMALAALVRLDLLDRPAEVVLGGGLLTAHNPVLHEEIAARIAVRAPLARVRLLADPPVLGAALRAFDLLGTTLTTEPVVRGSLSAALA
ncbi:MAG: N-acetylglucosamine kinase [Mycobacteriales bacterium]